MCVQNRLRRAEKSGSLSLAFDSTVMQTYSSTSDLLIARTRGTEQSCWHFRSRPPTMMLSIVLRVGRNCLHAPKPCPDHVTVFRPGPLCAARAEFASRKETR